MILKKVIGLFSTIVLLSMVFYMIAEPSVTQAVNAGPDTATVTATVTGEIDISSPTDTTFSSSIPGMTGNPGAPVTASLTWTVKTNNATGFNMTLKSATCGAQVNVLCLDASNYFTNASTTVAYSWPAPSSSAANFGFTVEPATNVDTATAFLDGGASCGAGTTYTADKCWSGFNSSDPTTPITVVNRTSSTTSSGEAELIKFRAESNAKFLKSGTTYTATVIATVAMNG